MPFITSEFEEVTKWDTNTTVAYGIKNDSNCIRLNAFNPKSRTPGVWSHAYYEIDIKKYRNPTWKAAVDTVNYSKDTNTFTVGYKGSFLFTAILTAIFIIGTILGIIGICLIISNADDWFNKIRNQSKQA